MKPKKKKKKKKKTKLIKKRRRLGEVDYETQVKRQLKIYAVAI